MRGEQGVHHGGNGVPGWGGALAAGEGGHRGNSGGAAGAGEDVGADRGDAWLELQEGVVRGCGGPAQPGQGGGG